MKNMIDYVKEMGGYTFDDRFFNEVDSLILCQLTYLKYEKSNYNFEGKPISLFEIYKEGLVDELCTNIRAPQLNRELIIECAQSVRFSNVILYTFHEMKDISFEEQFSVCVFEIKPNVWYVGYRGTDCSLVGWKEDFNMSFSSQIPSQMAAASFFRYFNKTHPGEYMLGGHSKGGNIAVFSAMLDTEANILGVFSFDGPGFLNDEIHEAEYNRIRGRIHKFIPRTSVIGLLMEEEVNYKVIDSDGFFLYQHDPFKWGIEDSHFIYLDSVDELSKRTKQAVDDWMLREDVIQREKFVDAAFSLMNDTSGETIKEIAKNWKDNYKIIYQNIQALDDVTKNEMKQALSVLFQSGKDQFGDYITETKNSWLGK